jgi:gliding motility-associated-like protein
VTLNISNVSCFGADDGTLEFVPLDAEGDVEYSIDGGLTFVSEPLFENLPGNTTFTLFAMDAAGKVYTDTVTIIEPSEIILSWSVSPAECNAFSETGSISLAVSGGAGGYTFLWSDGSTDKDRVNIGAGVYYLQTSDANGCLKVDTLTVSSRIRVNAYAEKDTAICRGSSVQLFAAGGYTASWFPTDYLDDPNALNPIVSGLTEPMTYILTMTEDLSGYGCFNTDTVTISILPPVGLTASGDTFLLRGSSVQLSAGGGQFSEFRWDPSTWLDDYTLADPVATPLESIVYTVSATNEFGCEEADSVYIEVLENIRVYNVFTPNMDGYNDYFEIEAADRFPEMVVEVYSRWGDLLFSARGYDDGSRWDGTSRGKEVPMGTYYYVIIPYSGAKPITGNVTIIR